MKQPAGPGGHLVRLEGVHKWFGNHHVLRGVDLTMEQRDVLVIIGPSGSGKSTLLRCVNMLEIPTQGQVWFEGQDVTDIRCDLNELRTHIGLVFQSFNLFPHMTALRNVTVALERVLKLPVELGEGPRDGAVGTCRDGEQGPSAIPGQLSGGQQQRVAIARALAMRTEDDALRRGDLGARPGARR